MSDAFSAGISAGQNYNQMMQQQAAMYSQIYSHMMLQQQALETQKAQAFYTMQLEMQKSADSVKLQTLKETGDTYRENLKQEGENKRNYLTQLTLIQMKQMDAQSAAELAMFNAQANKDREMSVEGLRGQNSMATTLVTAKSHVLAAQITGQMGLFGNLLGLNYGPEQAGLIMKYMNDPVALGYVTGGQPSPKAMMEMAKAKREMQTAILQWGAIAPDGSIIPGIEWQKLAAAQHENMTKDMAFSSEAIARLQPMIDTQMALMQKRAGDNGVPPQQFAASIQGLNDVASWLAKQSNPQDPETRAKATQQIMPLVRQSGVPLAYLQNYVGTRGALAYAMQRGAGVYSLAFNAMPTQQMMELQNQLPPDARSAVEKIATYLGGWVPLHSIAGGDLTGKTQQHGIGEAGGYATSGATIDVDQTLRSYWADQFKRKNGRAPGTKDAETFTAQVAQMSPSQKILTLQTLVPQNDSGAQLVRQAAMQQRTFTDSLSNLVFGDLGKSNDAAHPLEGHYGLTGVGGDLALALVGSTVLGFATSKALPIATSLAGKVLPESVMGLASKSGAALSAAAQTEVRDVGNVFKNASNAWDVNAGNLINGGSLLAPADRQTLMNAAGLHVNANVPYPIGRVTGSTPEQVLGKFLNLPGMPRGIDPLRLPGLTSPAMGVVDKGPVNPFASDLQGVLGQAEGLPPLSGPTSGTLWQRGYTNKVGNFAPNENYKLVSRGGFGQVSPTDGVNSPVPLTPYGDINAPRPGWYPEAMPTMPSNNLFNGMPIKSKLPTNFGQSYPGGARYSGDQWGEQSDAPYRLQFINPSQQMQYGTPITSFLQQLMGGQ